MGAKVIVLTNQKGGCGKTTLAMNIAGTLAIKAKTLVIDGDLQGSASRWASSCSDEKPYKAAVMSLANIETRVNREINKYIPDYEYIVVDCPPAMNGNFTSSALLSADLVLVPIIPSPTDLWAAIGIQKLIAAASDLNEKIAARLIANMCQSNSTISKEALDLIKEFEFPKLKTDIYQRTAYRQAAVFGGTVQDLDNAKAKSEINNIIKEILAILYH